MEKAQFDIYNKIDPDAEIRVAFDQKNPNWQYAQEYNHHFIQVMFDHLQHKLMVQGYLFVNDVLLQLGIDRTPEGQLLGWRRDDATWMDYSFTSDSEGGWIVLKGAKFIWHTL